MIYQKLIIFIHSVVIVSLGCFFSFNKFNPERQRQKVMALAYAEILFAGRVNLTQ
jgi:hypothetical protein